MTYKLIFRNFILAVALASAGALQTFAHEDHAHPDGLHFSHPLITESPSPDTKIRLDYFFLNVDGEVEDEELGEEGEGPSKFKESTVNLELEYAFTRNISIEADIPYTFINPDEGKDVNHFNNNRHRRQARDVHSRGIRDPPRRGARVRPADRGRRQGHRER